MKIRINVCSIRVIAAALLFAGAARAEWLDGWKFRRSMTIDSSQIDADLTDFPLIVRVTPGVIDFSQARPDGLDIRFTTDDGATLLDFEIEEYSLTGLYGNFWVRIPRVDNTCDTVFYIYYGCEDAADTSSPSNVWDDNHMAVWHLNQDNSELQVDSTSHGRHLAVFGDVAEGEAGQVGKAVGFSGAEGDEQYLLTKDQPYPSVDVTEGITYSAWAFSTNNANSTIIASGGGNWSPYRITYMGRDGTALRCNSSGGAGRSHDSWGLLGSGFSKDSWHHVAMTVHYDPQADESTMWLYLDGTLIKSGVKENVETLRNPFSGHPFVIGARNHHAVADTRIFFNGMIDEARVSNTRRSAAWIAASYRNQRPASTMIVKGDIESALDWYHGWGERRLITIDHTLIEAELTNFPVLVRLGLDNFDFAKARPDGHDIRFTAADGVTLLNLEREYYNPTERNGAFWVRVPLVNNTSDTTFYLYYGRKNAADIPHSSDVWDNSYEAVWHLGQNGSTQTDSTDRNRHLDIYGSLEEAEPGVIGTAVGLTGSSANPVYLITPKVDNAYPEIDTSAGLTFSAWAFPTKESEGGSNQDTRPIIGIGGGNWGSPYFKYLLAYYSSNKMQAIASGSVGFAGYGQLGARSAGFYLNKWSHVAMTLKYDETVNETTMRLYVDGAMVDMYPLDGNALRNPLSGRPIVVGGVTQSAWPGSNPRDYFNGWIDEARVSNIERSAAWIRASYLNQKTTGQLLRYGKPEHPERGTVFLVSGGALKGELPALFDRGRSRWGIYTDSVSHPTVEHAVEELVDALKKISGINFPVQRGGSPAPNSIIVGDISSQLIQEAAGQLGLQSGETEQVAVATMDGHLFLAGNQPRGALYAVYSFLNRQLGIRWLWPGESGEFIPKMERFKIPALAYTHTPGYRFRGLHLCGDWRDHQAFRIWMGRNFVNIHRHAASVSEKRLGFHSFYSNHSAHLKESDYFATHPEYFAEINGKRYPTGICLTNPDVLALVAERARGILSKDPQIEILSLFPTDTQDYCRCSECSTMTVSTAWFSFHNQLTDILKNEYPNLKFSTIAYQGYRQVPDCEVRNLLFMEYATLMRCNTHTFGINGCENNDLMLSELDAWEQTGLNIGNYGYEFDVFSKNSCFLPFFSVIEDAIREGHRRGQLALITEVSLSPATGPLTSVNNVKNRLPIYLYSQLMWDPARSADELIDEWCRTVYGAEAAPYMLDYFRTMDNSWSAMPQHIGILGNALNIADSFITPTLIENANTNFAETTQILLNAVDTKMRDRALEALDYEKTFFKQWQNLVALKEADMPTVNAPLLSDFSEFGDNVCRPVVVSSNDNPAEVRVAWTDDSLLLRWYCHEENINQMRANATQHDGAVLDDDAVAVEVSTGTSGESYLFGVNSINTRIDFMNTSAGTRDLHWNPTWQSAVEIKSELWEVEFAIPFAALGHTPLPGDIWQIQLRRTGGGRIGRHDSYFPDIDSSAMLYFSDAAITGRRLLYWSGAPEREAKNDASIKQNFMRRGWEVNICTNMQQLMASHPQADAFWFAHPNGQIKVPTEYWQHLPEAINNGATAIFSSYWNTPVNNYLQDSGLKASVVIAEGVPLAGRRTANVTSGPWGTQPHNLAGKLMSGYSPYYGMIPALDSDWTVLAISPFDIENTLHPYLLAHRYGKGLVVLGGHKLPALESEIVDNFVDWNRRMLESLSDGVIDISK